MRNIQNHGPSPSPSPSPSPARADADARRLRDLLVGFARRRSLRDPVAGMCEEVQLTAPQIHALLALGHDGPLTMGEVARRVGITEKTITGVIDRLEGEGYVARERDAGDRRVVRCQLTDEGARVQRDLDAHIQEKLSLALGLLDPPDREALFRILERLLQRLEQHAAGSPETRKP